MAREKHVSSDDLPCLVSPAFSIVSITVYTTVCIATIFGNILILLSIHKYSNRFKGSMYMLIGNLAVADLLLGVWMTFYIYEKIFPEVRNFRTFCMVDPVGIIISFCCSTLSLLVISIDRFMAVIFPLKYLIQTHKRTIFITILTVVWLISTVTGSLHVFRKRTEQRRNRSVCNVGEILPRMFQLLPLGLLLVMLIILTLYGIILRKIITNETPGNNTIRPNNSKTVMMILVFVIFMVFWLPFMICVILMELNLVPSLYENVLCAREYLIRLGFINSALNWIIYGLTNNKFRTAFRNILCWKC